MPEKAAALREKLHAWRESVAAQMPAPNPKYDPSLPPEREGEGRKTALSDLPPTEADYDLAVAELRED